VTATGLDDAPRTICLICRSVLVRSTGFDGRSRWVHESGRNVWFGLHHVDNDGFTEPMPLNEAP